MPKTILNILLHVLILLFPINLLSETIQNEKSNIFPATNQIKIDSSKLEINNKLNIITFTGDVSAIRDDFTLNCQKLLLYLNSAEGKSDSDTLNAGIEKIVATEKVTISREDGSLAMADKVVYYQATEKMVLTGNPVVRQGDNSIEGTSITLFLNDNPSIIKNPKAVMYLKSVEDDPLGK